MVGGMARGSNEGADQGDLHLTYKEGPRSQGRPSYPKLNEILKKSGFDEHVESL